ncbi:MAG: hypothetical protein AAF208_09405 [Cyanobacteria bacterium P01_A01_bin.45]
MKKLNVKQKQWLISTHVVFAGTWFGTALCMIAISLMKSDIASGDELYALNAVMKMLDDFVIIPSAILSLLSGTLLCWLTIWGFFKHYWVVAKWVATVTLIVTGTIWLGPWTNAMTSISAEQRLLALENPLYVFDGQAVLIGAIAQTSSLLVVIIISFLKPWGKREIKPNQTK